MRTVPLTSKRKEAPVDSPAVEPQPGTPVAEEGGVDDPGKRIGMWFFLFTEILFFGGMFLLYSIYRYRFAAEFHAGALEEKVVLGSINTAVLLTSSLFMALAISALRRG